MNKRIIVDAFLNWFSNDPHSNKEDFYSNQITKKHLKSLSKEEFISFFYEFAREGGKVQSGGQRTAPKLKKSIENEYDLFRNRIMEVFEDDFDLKGWLQWVETFPHFGKGLSTIFLNRLDKHKYVIVNEKSIDGLKALGYSIPYTRLYKTYKAIQNAKNQLFVNFPELKNYFRVDSMMHFMIGTPEGKAAVERAKHSLPDSAEMDNPNLILFGPPGTGKTYHTVNEAVKIINPKFYNQHKEAESRKALRDEFNRLLIKNWEDPKGQIAFCTFHQSFAYEDFVEGIKPEPTEGAIIYDVRPGIFKRICDLAESNYSAIKVIKEGKLTWSEKYYKKAAFFKMSLGDATKESDNEIYNYCKEHQFISIGSGGNNDFRGLSENQVKDKCENLNCNKSEAIQLNYFIHKLKKNDYVLVSFGNTYLRAIGKIVGDYEYMEDSPIRYNHFRKVEWVFVDEKIPVEEVYDRPFTQNTIYKIDKNGLNKNFFTGKDREETIEQKEDKRYVLIIDEINRGNIANIFGELITLIEKDKRAGQSEELEVVLPYSKKRFKVPPNLYIIGTMNTADRSIEALDTALRRRFSFREMPPDTSLIKDAGKLKPTGIITDSDNGQEIDVVRLVDKINERIEKLIDKDHKIGHSYFMNIQNIAELRAAFKDKVIPLLEEYFFGDFGKIGLVLGNSFVERVNQTNFDFASFDGYKNDGGIEHDLAERPVYRIKKPDEPGAWDFEDVYKKKSSDQ